MNHYKFIVSWLLIILILGSSFYWYEWRTMKARISCLNEMGEGKIKITDEDINIVDKFAAMKNICLFGKGIKE